MSFTQNSFPAIRNDINAALAAVGKKYGMQLSIDRITYTETTFRTSINAVLDSAASESTPAETSNEIKWKSTFMRMPSRYGMTADDFGKQVKVNGSLYTIAGARPKAHDIVLKRPNGTYIAYGSMGVKSALNAMLG